MKKILIIRNDNIGDLACTTLLIEVLRGAYPSAIIDILGNSYNSDLLRYDPRISNCWSYEKAKHFPGVFKKIKAWFQKIKLLLELRCRRYDLAFIAVPIFNRRTTQLASIIHPKIIIGAETKHRPLPRNYHHIRIDHKLQHALQVLSYAKTLGITFSKPKEMILHLSAEEKAQVIEERSMIQGDSNKPVIGLQISARRPKQRYQLEQWKQLIELLLPQARIRLLWSPGTENNPQHPGDDTLAGELVKKFPKKKIFAHPTTDLRSLMIAFAGCDLVIGPDGGAMHIAAALGPITLTLFGDIDPHIWRPYSQKGHVLTSRTDRLQDLPPEVVAEKALKLIEEISTKNTEE